MGLHRDPDKWRMHREVAERRRWAWWHILLLERLVPSLDSTLLLKIFKSHSRTNNTDGSASCLVDLYQLPRIILILECHPTLTPPPTKLGGYFSRT